MSSKYNNCILLVNPSVDYESDLGVINNRKIEKDIPNQESPPIGIAYIIASAKRQGVDVKFIDMISRRMSIQDLIKVFEEMLPAIVGFSAYTVQIKGVEIIAGEIKKRFPDINICVGGPHPIALPERTLEEFPSIDFVVPGEAEYVLPDALRALEQGKTLNSLKGITTRKTEKLTVVRIKNLDELPYPAWEAFDLQEYPGCYPHRTKLELPMLTSRGCPFSCVFCARASGKRKRTRSVISVIEEIERNISEFGCESICFLDETFVLDKKWINEFLNEVGNRGLNKLINWSCSMRVSGVTEDLVSRMRKAGCYYIFFGLESGDDRMLKLMKKNITVEQIRNAVRLAKREGIICVGSFIIGLPEETEESVEKSISLAEELDLYSVTFPIAVPLPGSPLYEMAEMGKYGLRILSYDWSRYGKQYPGVMECDNLSIERRRELQSLAYERNPKKKLTDWLASLR
ncbi:MAG: B12-binding domain-containing radical SAM protein [Planctomycetota bacterium]|jgi:radical SAM superfamily enzyme YgiQ (UPF0313 family)